MHRYGERPVQQRARVEYRMLEVEAGCGEMADQRAVPCEYVPGLPRDRCLVVDRRPAGPKQGHEHADQGERGDGSAASPPAHPAWDVGPAPPNEVSSALVRGAVWGIDGRPARRVEHEHAGLPGWLQRPTSAARRCIGGQRVRCPVKTGCGTRSGSVAARRFLVQCLSISRGFGRERPGPGGPWPGLLRRWPSR